MTADDRTIHASYRLLANRLFPGGGEAPLQDRIIEISNGKISHILPLTDMPDEPADAAPLHQFDIVAPGFIDLQINGAGGAMFNDMPDTATLACMASAAGKGGTCHLLPTFITAPGTSYMAALDAVAAWDGPEILGVHLEGPFLSREKPGIHPPDAIRPMTDDDVARLCGFVGGFSGRLMLTLAPEEAAPTHLKQLHDAGIILFAGHSRASAREMSLAVDLGLRGVTHLFNACSQMTAREPGVVGAAFTDSRLVAGIIADGHHVAPDNLALAAKVMAGRLCLVSDSMQTYGSTIDSFRVADRQVRLVDGRLQAEDGTLGGAHLGLDEAVRMMVTKAGVPLTEALDMASGVPANILGLAGSYGRIETGRPASLSCLDETLAACAVVVGGILSHTDTCSEES